MQRVSVVIPCYNAEEHIGQAIESVLAQTREPLEILVIDDCSSDGSVDVIRSFDGVHLLENPVNMGNGLVRNRAIFEAHGELIAFLDADDVWLPHHLETVAGLLEENQEAAVGFSAVEFFGSREGAWRTRLPESQPADAFWECLRSTAVPQMTAVVRHAVLAEVGGYQQPSPAYRSAPDYDLWLRISRNHLFVATREITARYRWHPSQISQTANDDQIAAVYHSRWNLLQELQREPKDERHRGVAVEIRRCWIEDYMKAYHARDMKQIRLLDEIRLRLFPSMHRPRRVWLRSMIPERFLRSVDSLRGIDGAGAS